MTDVLFFATEVGEGVSRMKKFKTWVVVADGARGRLFHTGEGNELLSIADRDLIGDKLPNREVDADRQGRTYDSNGSGRHAMEPRSRPKRRAKMKLAHEIVQILDAERKNCTFDKLIIVAPPQFLGDLRAAMPKLLLELVEAEVEKDLSKLAPNDLLAHLGDVLQIKQ